LRYEDFADDNRAFLGDLLDYLEILIPPSEFDKLCERHSFQRQTGGREQGIEDQESHYRKGVPGDWRNYFDDSVMARFREVTGDSLERLGYSE
jgi:hypothetical protein